VKQLIGAGHQVTGLARSDAAGKKPAAAGAQVQLGTVEDLDCLRRGASAADGAIHTAFYHKIAHISLGKRLQVMFGGAPSGAVQRFLQAAVTTDRRAIEAIAQSLSGADRLLVATFGTLGMTAGRLAIEDDAYNPTFVGVERARTEDTLKALATVGIRTSAMRRRRSCMDQATTALHRCWSRRRGRRRSPAMSEMVRTVGLPFIVTTRPGRFGWR